MQYWFRKTLEPYTEREYDGPRRVVLVMKGPREVPMPKRDITVTEIVMKAYRNGEGPIRSDRKSEVDATGRKNVPEDLGPVMVFQFLPIRGGTRVSASYRDIAGVRQFFKGFVTEEIEKWYPAVGGLWQKHEEELERQDQEIFDRSGQTESGAVGAETGADTGADTGATTEGGAETKQTKETPAPTGQADAAKQRRGPYRDQRKKMRAMWKTREAGVRVPFSVAWQDQALTYETVTEWIPKRIAEDWQTRKQFTWAEFTELWPEHLRDDTED